MIFRLFYSHYDTRSASQHQIWKRLTFAVALAFLLHFIFLFVLSPYLKWNATQTLEKTKIVQISPQELARIKQRMKAMQNRPALLEHELRPEYQSKEAPKDASMVGKFNQSVSKEKRARIHNEAPMPGAVPTPSAPLPKKSQLSLSQLGLKQKMSWASQSHAQRTNPQIARPRGLSKTSNDQETLLNAVESRFYSFFARLEEPILRNWYFIMRTHSRQLRTELAQKQVAEGAEFAVTIQLTIDQKGAFQAVDILEPSGLNTFDQLTKQSIEKVGSLPNPPIALFEGQPTYSRAFRFLLYINDAAGLTSGPVLDF